ncbi:MAG: acyltransferase family protein [Myxococcales bacterium]|nr:acyltransferase family protein [Myxococcales bacterium]
MLARVEEIELPWSVHGYDPYGISKRETARMFTLFSLLYRRYFRVRATGVENIPLRGRAMLVGNHSGGVAIDGAMVITSAFLELARPRLAQGMAEKFINRVPFASLYSSRTGQFTGLPEHAERLLEDERLLMVFPEGARGTAKLYWERHSLVEFGSGFVRLALKTRTPIIPVGILGGGDVMPTVLNSYALGRALGAPYVPVTPYLLPIPLPAKMELHYGEPIVFEGTGAEDDDVIGGYVERVKRAVAGLMAEGLKAREGTHS